MSASSPHRYGRENVRGRSRSGASLLAGREQRAIARLVSTTPIVRAGGRRGHEVALTFDDGPGPYTPQVIRVLRRHHAAATFFEVGFMLRWFHASTAREVADQFAVGDHTEMHAKMGHLPPAAQREQILEQASAVRVSGAPLPVLFRPPFGSFNETTLTLLRRLHMLMVLWTVDTRDYTPITPKT